MTEGFWNVWNQTDDLVLCVDEHTGVLIWYYTWPVLLNILPISFEFVFLFLLRLGLQISSLKLVFGSLCTYFLSCVLGHNEC